MKPDTVGIFVDECLVVIVRLQQVQPLKVAHEDAFELRAVISTPLSGLTRIVKDPVGVTWIFNASEGDTLGHS